MATKKSDAVADSVVVPAQDAVEVVFSDQVFSSRKLILPGRVVPVVGGFVTATDTELRDYLDAHAEFKRAE